MLAITFSIITSDPSGKSRFGFAPLSVRFENTEAAMNFVQSRGYKPDKDQPFVLTKALVKDGLIGTAFAVISELSEPEDFFESETDSANPEMLS